MTRRILFLPAAALCLTIALAGCSTVFSGTSSAIAPGSPDVASGGYSASGGAAGDSGSTGTKVDDSALAQRSVIQTGTAVVTVETPKDAADAAARIVSAAGGRVDARSETAPTQSDRGSATVTLRIPSSAFEATLTQLEGLGTVQSVNLQTQDVTADVQDLGARITASRASIDRLLALLAKATDTKDLVQIEEAVASRQSDLESMETQQRYLADQVSMSTLDLQLVSVADAPVQEPNTFLSGLGAGWGSFVAFLSGTLVVIGVALPWLAFAGVIAAVVVVLVRARRRRSRRADVSEPAA
jgi:hypothetical protein